ncbi:hypothetical protein PRIPAC_97187 [Pristionchus pacificus]|uniref:G protein-coupled receptor n=1 Tax=Pristionchus pacificus TaxID=54126 RepID=A0A2A6BJF3_PRIPA|nr:hypothetical protein PRIPAC_97187 [Pristionchus pacificus]|eukprot:PDM66017.1 G protein-coupled receptor [Pristionchus pacificus]
MVAHQFQFMPTMIQGAAYNCSAVMPPGPEWAEKYGVRRIPFGIYSFVFGVITEILYVPCMFGLRREMKTSCFKIMFWLSIFDMIALMANSILFGALLLEGAVYCSNRIMTLGVGIVGYGIWLTCSATCLVLGLNRLFDIMDLSRFFTVVSLLMEVTSHEFQNSRTNIYLQLCVAYGVFMVSVNSTHQSMFFSPYIPGHSVEEYVNWAHAAHNITVAIFSCLLYISLSAVLLIKKIFVQVVIICGSNLIGTLIYVYANFLPTPPAVIVAGHVAWQLIHGSPPMIYLTLNKNIRNYTLRSLGLSQAVGLSSGLIVIRNTGSKIVPLIIESLVAATVAIPNILLIVILIYGSIKLFKHHFYIVVANLVVLTSLKAFVELAFVLPYYLNGYFSTQYELLIFNLSVLADYGILFFSFLIAVNRYFSAIKNREKEKRLPSNTCSMMGLITSCGVYQQYFHKCLKTTPFMETLVQCVIYTSYVVALIVILLYVRIFVYYQCNGGRKQSTRASARNVTMQLQILKQNAVIFTLYVASIVCVLVLSWYDNGRQSVSEIAYAENLLNLSIAGVYPICFLFMSGEMRSVLVAKIRPRTPTRVGSVSIAHPTSPVYKHDILFS